MAGLNEATLANAAAARPLRTTGVSADTTVLPATVATRPDSGDCLACW
jgi:hypothetical protein